MFWSFVCLKKHFHSIFENYSPFLLAGMSTPDNAVAAKTDKVKVYNPLIDFGQSALRPGTMKIAAAPPLLLLLVLFAPQVLGDNTKVPEITLPNGSKLTGHDKYT